MVKTEILSLYRGIMKAAKTYHPVILSIIPFISTAIIAARSRASKEKMGEERNKKRMRQSLIF
jgi:hypothetical protein